MSRFNSNANPFNNHSNWLSRSMLMVLVDAVLASINKKLKITKLEQSDTIAGNNKLSQSNLRFKITL